MKEHECIIGGFYTFDNVHNVTLTKLKEEVKYNELRYNYLIEEKTRGGISGIVTKPYLLKDYLDLRKHANFTHYTYCPICGKKIDWAKIRKENK